MFNIFNECLIYFNILLISFKHNTSFVSRFSTIRRHKSTHSPLTRNRFGVSSAPDHRSRDDSSRIPGSLSEDSVAKDISDASKRNSDGMSLTSPQ